MMAEAVRRHLWVKGRASPRSVDAVFYAAGKWVPNPEVERLAHSHLKPGMEMNP